MAFSAMKKIFKLKAAEPSATPSATSYATPSATPSATSSATTLKQFLELTEACNEQAQEIFKPRSNVYRSHRVNYEQCRHLAQKLRLAVERARLFLLLRIGEALLLEELEDVFKLLHALANAVEEVIRSCYQDPWIQSAFLMTNVSEHVLSISFDLGLLAELFSGKVLTLTKVYSFYTTEAFIVIKKASQDREALLTHVNTLLQLGEETSSEYQLADLLLKRLETQRQNLAGSLPEAYRTDMGRLKEKEQLGRGSFATVFKAMWLGVEVAKKTFYAPSSPEFAKEVSILGSLSHPNITSLLCYAEGKRECCMVMELMDGDLSQMMRKIMADDKTLGHPFRILEAFDIMLQIGGGMEYLHGKRLVHRDLKAMNILVKHVKGRELESKTVYTFVKVADFGLSKTKERSMTYGNQTLMVGTARWMAPELIKSNSKQEQEQVSTDAMIAKYPFASDVYSFGMVCYEILTGEWPHFEVENLSEVKKKVLMGDRPKLPLYCPPGLKDLIERCWSEDASKRPRFSEICAELRLLKYAQILNPYCIPPKIVVGLDFGTTFSGFAFAHTSKPEEITTFYDWPTPLKSYCKTLTAIYYEAGDATTAKVKSWGFPAIHDYWKDINNTQKLRAKSMVDLPETGTYLVRFKLHLASKDAGESPPPKLPKGFTVTQVIADYLQEIGAFIMRHLRTKFGDDLTMAEVHWCVTVPSIWDDHVKKQMQVCMARAGLIRSVNSPAGSPHPLSIVLEPEAASCYCHRNMPDLELKVGDRLLVVDIGGVTTDIVVQEWMSETPDDFRVKEVTYSTGRRCGGTYVDEQFNKFLFAKIQCLPQFLRKSTAFMEKIFNRWEEIKCSFGDLVTIGESFEIKLPSKLAAEWEEFDEVWQSGNPPRSSYDELELTHADIKAIFDPVVEQNLALIADQISRTSNVKVIFVVGGFAGSPYLLTKIKERFLGTVEKVISPVQPASAVSQGAVMLAFDHILYSRRSKFACNADSESRSTSMLTVLA